MRVLLDTDGVLADFTGHLARWITHHGVPYRDEDFSTYNLKDCMRCDLSHRLLARAPHDANFCWSIPRYVGAQKFVKDILAQGVDLAIVTAPWTGPYHTQAREEWIESFLSFPGGNRVEFHWATTEERVRMGGDVLVEDRLETAAAWSRTGRKAVIMDRPWNRNYPAMPAAEGTIHVARDYAQALEHIFG